MKTQFKNFISNPFKAGVIVLCLLAVGVVSVAYATQTEYECTARIDESPHTFQAVVRDAGLWFSSNVTFTGRFITSGLLTEHTFNSDETQVTVQYDENSEYKFARYKNNYMIEDRVSNRTYYISDCKVR